MSPRKETYLKIARFFPPLGEKIQGITRRQRRLRTNRRNRSNDSIDLPSNEKKKKEKEEKKRKEKQKLNPLVSMNRPNIYI